MLLLLRPFALLLGFDIGTVNPPGAAGRFIQSLTLVHHYLLPAAYMLAGLLLPKFAGPVRWGLTINLLAEAVVVAFSLYIMEQSDMLYVRQVPAVLLAGLYLLAPIGICIFAWRTLATSAER